MFIKMKKTGVKSFLIFASIFLIFTSVLALSAYVSAPIDHGTLGVSDTSVVGNILQITTGDPTDGILNTRDWIPCWGVNPWSKDGQWIAYQSQINGTSESYYEICILKADGTGYARLTNNSVPDTHANFTPDGTKIVFQRYNSDSSRIWIMDRDGSNAYSLTDQHGGPVIGGCGEQKPVISPDGTKIAFRAESYLYVMNIDGTNPVQVSDSDATKHSWSPDSKWVLFSLGCSSTDDNSRIYKVRPDGSDSTDLTAVGVGSGYEILGCENWPAWSPDGQWISYHRRIENSETGDTSEIWLMKPDGTEKHVLVSAIPDGLVDDEWVCGPHSWHPGSQYVVFKKSVSDSPLSIININDGHINQLTKDYSDGRMWWGPTGDKILFHEYNSNGTTSGTSRDGGLYSSDLLIINLASNFSYSGGSVGDTGKGGGGGGGCFIATAAFGSPMAGQVEILRNFRDRYLLTNAVGKKFVSLYYRYSPAVASFIADKPLVKAAVRATLYPLIGFSLLLLSGYLPLVIVGLLLSTLVFLRFRPKKLSNV